MTARSLVDSSHVLIAAIRPWADANFSSWAPGHRMARHSHRWPQTIHVLEGALEVDWGEGWRRIAPGEVHVLPPTRSHSLRTTCGHAQFGVNFSPAPDERGILSALLQAYPLPCVVSMPFRQTWDAALRAHSPRGSAAALRCIHALEDYTLALVERAAPRARDAAAQRLAQYLEDAATRAVSVAEVAGALHASRASVQRLCARHFGCGVAHLHEKIRLGRAAELLLAGDGRIGEVAAQCGYADIYQFSRAFARVRGVAPTEFRRRTRQGQA